MAKKGLKSANKGRRFYQILANGKLIWYNIKNKWAIARRKEVSDMPKREDYISWDEYFMGVALLSAKRSKDPSTQVGACIVSKDNRIVSVGYNGMPKGCSDDDFPWERTGDMLDTKYPFVCHAELNAVLNTGGNNLAGCRVYVALFPCNECTKALIQAGITEVVYLSDKYAHTDAVKASKRMMDSAGVVYRQMKPEKTEIRLSLREQDV